MQNKPGIKRYFNQEKADGPPDKKQKFQKKQKQGGGPKGPGAFAKSQEKAKFQGPKEKKMKRKPEETAKQNGGGPLKKIPFPGTAQLHVKKAEKKQKNEEVPSTQAPSPEVKLNRAKQRRLKNRAKRQISKQNFSTVVESMQKGDVANIEKIKEKIANIQSRDTLSTTARKKLRKLQAILKLAGVAPEGSGDVKRIKVEKGPIKTEKNIEAKKQSLAQKNEKKFPVKKPVKEEVQAEDSEEEESSEDDPKIAIKPQMGIKKDESEEEDEESGEEEASNQQSSDESQDFREVDNSKAEFLPLEAEGDDSADEEASDEEDDEEEDDDSDDEEEESEKEEESPKEVIRTPQKQRNIQNESPKENKSRYIVFVGNLPYNIEKEQLMQHFKKVGEIQDVRLAIDHNTKKGRGFAYVELKNEDTYQKALGLNHTFIAGRKINVEYTKGGKKKGEDAKKEIKAKNMKLREMRKQGKFGGVKNPSQKRAERRFKQKGSK